MTRPEGRVAKFATRPSGLVIYTGDDGPRVYVPEKRRKPLFKWFHETAGHVAAAKTHSLIMKDYYWPNSSRDVQKWYQECPHCELSKSKRNLAHGTYRAGRSRAPRSRWGMDFYGVGDSYVLGMIDLDSLWVELVHLPDRSAEGVAQAIRDRIYSAMGRRTKFSPTMRANSSGTC